MDGGSCATDDSLTILTSAVNGFNGLSSSPVWIGNSSGFFFVKARVNGCETEGRHSHLRHQRCVIGSKALRDTRLVCHPSPFLSIKGISVCLSLRVSVNFSVSI